MDYKAIYFKNSTNKDRRMTELTLEDLMNVAENRNCFATVIDRQEKVSTKHTELKAF